MNDQAVVNDEPSITVLIAESKEAQLGKWFGSFNSSKHVEAKMESPLQPETDIRCGKVDNETSDVPVTNLRKFFNSSTDRLQMSETFGKLGLQLHSPCMNLENVSTLTQNHC